MGLLSLVTSACVGHVRLPAAPRRAPLEYRVAVYNAYRPVQMEYVGAIAYGYGVMVPSPNTTIANGLILANGTRVTEPEDLVRLAGRRSLSASAARGYVSANRTADVLTWTSIGVAAVGLSIAAASIFVQSPASWGPNWPMFGVGLGVDLLSVVPLFIGVGVRSGAAQQRQRAFETFDASLMNNLGLTGIRPNTAGSVGQLSSPIELRPPAPAQPPTQPTQPVPDSPIETVRPVQDAQAAPSATPSSSAAP